MKTKPLESKTALVTGASRGIGRAIALRLAADGASVAVNYVGNEEAAAEAVEEIEKNGGNAVALQGDVRRTEDVRRLFDETEKAFGKLDILVNNAGVALEKTTPIAETTDEQYDRLFAVNARGTFMPLREAARRIADGGRIINISTTIIRMALPGYAVYAGSKAAVEMFTRILSKELEGRGITVNAVAPGPVETDLFNTGKTEEVKQRMADMAPLKRLGQPDDIARVVAFLAGDEGGWINGQILYANGGMA